MNFIFTSHEISNLSQQHQALALLLQQTNNISTQQNYSLIMHNNILQIKKLNSQQGPIFIDFTANSLQHRKDRLYQEPLLKAVKIKNKKNLHILDATAGFGTDSFLLAANGYTITALEQHPLMHALLENALAMAKQKNTQDYAINNLTFILQDACIYLTTLKANSLPDIIYLDPMFPEKQKSAKVNKEMEFLHYLYENYSTEQNNLNLFNLAILKAKHKVVIKRPIHAQFISQLKPNYSLKYRSTRFDIYLANN